MISIRTLRYVLIAGYLAALFLGFRCVDLILQVRHPFKASSVIRSSPQPVSFSFKGRPLIEEEDAKNFDPGNLRDPFSLSDPLSSFVIAQPHDSVPSFRVLGILISQRSGIVLEDTAQVRTFVLSEGEKGEGILVKKIEKDAVWVDVGGREIRLDPPSEKVTLPFLKISDAKK